MNTLKFFVYLFFSGAFLVIVLFLIHCYKNWRRMKEAEENLYDMKYLWLQDHVRCSAVTEDNYHMTCNLFHALCELKHKNPEKTDVLYKEFLKRFISVAK